MDFTYLPEKRRRLSSNEVDRIFTRLVHDLRRRIVGLVDTMIGDVHAADDIAQETFIKLHNLLRKEKVGRTLPAWIRRVATNAARDYIRRRGAAPAVCPTDRLISAPAPAGLCASRREFCHQAMGLLDRLPPLDRRICELRIHEALTFPEISQLTGTSLDKAKKRYYATIERLGRLWHADAPQSQDSRLDASETEEEED